MSDNFSIAIHGGAGVFSREQFPEALRPSYEAALTAAVNAGWEILKSGGHALDAVQAAAAMLEDCELFNAGHGSVLNEDGRIECDAALMAGDGRIGAVAGAHRVRNPITLARKLLDDGRAAFVSGAGAERLAERFGVELVDESYFITDVRRAELEEARRDNRVALDHFKFGTIGAVARDKHGQLAAATSTGGLTNKQLGRIGDTPIIGAGTYADNATCAVSCTGVGEVFMRQVVAHSVSTRLRFAGQSLHEAVREIVHHELPPIQGTGGLIAVDTHGNLTAQFNCASLYRAWRIGDAPPVARIFED